MGSLPLGGMLVGGLAERMGEPPTVALASICLLCVGLLARWLGSGVTGLK